ncbi:hypothetical protein M408DRAFT_25222 [Serendipita vermifera MAFF 305830]|uniref:Uncharacterized protein n=1 Tax=Serendipita vermifera MAFF 305830 TaxID=933852 RepID=A0A0C2WB32_SERVB|nr:hypothetical protein M408DRAFT_27808 [Serendipita vermifera MAFF 305830]KIM26502.1 hypothetical protein M408DRAFT_25222 [Serendipita vermifera MAFF 305830]
MQGRTLDLMKSLPYETWVRSMQFYAYDQPEGALPLLAVSMAWQYDLLRTPELWNTIYLDGGHDEDCRAECFFHLSRNEPVHLILRGNTQSMSSMIRHRHRISTLVFLSKPPEVISITTLAFRSQFFEGHSFPNLLHIYVEQLGSYPAAIVPDTLIIACPALIGLHSAYISSEIIFVLPSSAKTASIASFGKTEFSKDLGNRFECLFVYTPFHPEDGQWFNLFTSPTTHLEEFELVCGEGFISSPIRRPRTESSQNYISPIQAFVAVPHHGLRILRVIMPWGDMKQLVPSFPTLTALRELELTLDYSSPLMRLWDLSPLTIADIGRLRKLSIASTEMGPIGLNRHNVALVIELFSEAGVLWDLRELRLTFPRMRSLRIPAILQLLQTTKRLRELHLLACEPFAAWQNSVRVLLGNLEKLVILKEDYLAHLEVPRLVCLTCMQDVADRRTLTRPLANQIEAITISFIIFFEWAQLVVAKDVASQPFPRLLELHAISQNWVCRHPVGILNLSALRVVSFVRDAGNLSTSDNGEEEGCLNQFMLELLFSPESCPRLHTIRSITYPSWALATAMFQRRNSLNAVTPIVSFWLPWYPQISILEIVSQAMGQTIGDNSPQLLIAVQIDRIIRQREADYWIYCIMSGYIRCILGDEKTGDDKVSTKMHLMDLSPMSTSTTVHDIFTKDDWIAHIGQTSHCYGEPFCLRQRGSEMVHIGPGTLYGKLNARSLQNNSLKTRNNL